MYDAGEVKQLIAKHELKMLQEFDQVSSDKTCTLLIMMYLMSLIFFKTNARVHFRLICD